jgi:hypothetical protein
MGKAMLTIMAAFAQLERDIMIERTRAGLAAAAANGRKGGRPRKIDERSRRQSAQSQGQGHCGHRHREDVGRLPRHRPPVSIRWCAALCVIRGVLIQRITVIDLPRVVRGGAGRVNRPVLRSMLVWFIGRRQEASIQLCGLTCRSLLRRDEGISTSMKDSPLSS